MPPPTDSQVRPSLRQPPAISPAIRGALRKRDRERLDTLAARRADAERELAQVRRGIEEAKLGDRRAASAAALANEPIPAPAQPELEARAEELRREIDALGDAMKALTLELLGDARKAAPRVAEKLSREATEREQEAEHHLSEAFAAARESAALGGEVSWAIGLAESTDVREVPRWSPSQPVTPFIEALRTAQEALTQQREVRARRAADRERAKQVLSEKADQRQRRAEAQEAADAEEREREAAERRTAA